MESLYSKLYDKYTKLKAKKFQELEKPNKDQEITFMNYVTAAEELIEHLRNEKERLNVQVNEMRNEVNSLRAKANEQLLECQDLLMEDNQKIKELKEENERLLKLQREGLLCPAKDSDMLQLDASEDDQTRPENNMTVRPSEKAKMQNVSHSGFSDEGFGHADPATIGQSGKELTFNEASAGSRMPECCRKINISSDGGGNKIEPANCLYQVLIESLVGMKLSASNELHGICISALHESSGYTFSLTWVRRAGKKEAELLYRVISLGTLTRVAPEWMREEIMFSINMCSLFFERVTRFIRLNH
uniref:DUF7806 domain-containing protein n=1 Tax=Kalanchoe fedtschenkoi TaxID=63787 RepID=A0A7N0THV8_KALFE